MTSQIFSWRKIIYSIKGTIFLVTCMLESMKIENLFQFPVGSSGTSILCSEDWAFFVKRATFSCQAFRTRWTQGWGDAPPIKFHQPLWVTIVKPRSFLNTTRIVSQDLLLASPRKSTGKINTVSLSLWNPPRVSLRLQRRHSNLRHLFS